MQSTKPPPSRCYATSHVSGASRSSTSPTRSLTATACSPSGPHSQPSPEARQRQSSQDATADCCPHLIAVADILQCKSRSGVPARGHRLLDRRRLGVEPGLAAIIIPPL